MSNICKVQTNDHVTLFESACNVISQYKGVLYVIHKNTYLYVYHKTGSSLINAVISTVESSGVVYLIEAICKSMPFYLHSLVHLHCYFVNNKTRMSESFIV